MAILIEASRITGSGDLPGARADVFNLTRWLGSNVGGAWNASEIVALSHPSTSVLEGRLAEAARADYALIAFSGHGEHVVGRLQNDTMIQINDREGYSVRRLSSGFRRGVVIADSCRYVRVQLSLQESVKYARKAYADASAARERHRMLFDAMTNEAEEGVVFMFGCSRNQGANDFPNGGAFSFGLVDQAEAWANRAPAWAVLSALEAFELAKQFVSQEVSGQVPEMDGSMRRRKHFPFSVVA